MVEELKYNILQRKVTHPALTQVRTPPDRHGIAQTISTSAQFCQIWAVSCAICRHAAVNLLSTRSYFMFKRLAKGEGGAAGGAAKGGGRTTECTAVVHACLAVPCEHAAPHNSISRRRENAGRDLRLAGR